MTVNRRRFLGYLGTGAMLAALPPWHGARAAPARVVVVGGGFGGATCAKYLRRYDAEIDITLVEASPQYVTCPGSNWVLGGLRGMADITHSYNGLKARGIDVVAARVQGIDAEKRRITLDNGDALAYDRLVVAPGIDFKWNSIEGYDEKAAEVLPHAYKAGPQTELLRRQLEAMPDGGVVVISIPGDPFRCPPGPYERASLIAHYLKTRKPKSKLLLLDTKDKFSKQGLFQAAWKERYPGMIEWVPGTQGGKVERIDVDKRTVYTQEGLESHRGDVVNIICPHHAGTLAHAAGLTDDSGWCPVNQASFESTIHPNIHVIGDACIAGAMPKSGHSANNQAKMCAAAIIALLREQTVPIPSHVNTCYSLVAPDYGISVAAVYHLKDGNIQAVAGSGGVSPAEADANFRRREALYAEGWYASIVSDSFG
ncbi:MAG: NAD(P)/FAD-dependent oxidoreductase [Gammaproteobacteria bacterium]|jgi:sulfide dehydrogenase [flavocytochrome c] flavoprotein subunit|nr:NAD(P)/FAD-dependent oxidoreductase [Gammaproteobacteria bacterium]